MGQQLQLFTQELPQRPYCTDAFQDGLKIRDVQQAMTKRYIQHNPPAQVRWVVFDCDYSDSLGRVQDANLPLPNIAAINRANGHSHLFYGLDCAVTRTNAGRVKPLAYLASVEYALCEALKADHGYAGLIAKNPLNDFWLVSELRPALYDLGELADYLTLPPKLPKGGKVQGLGRNCTLFEQGRKWAYRAVLGYRLSGDQAGFKAGVLSALLSLNSFPTPLPSREVESIAKSIAKWTWKHYTAKWSDEEFSLVQSNRAKKGKGVSRYRHPPETRSKALKMRSEGATLQEVATALGVTAMTVQRWTK